MANVKISAFAEADLREIWTYVAENNPSAADKLLRELLQKIRLLADNPELGKDRSEIIVNLRSFPVRKYIVFYSLNEDTVEIYRVLHASRNIGELFEDYFEGLDE